MKPENIKILFVMPFTTSNNKYNLHNKFLTQIHCAKKLCEEVYYTEYENGKIFIVDANNEEKKFVGRSLKYNQTFIQMHYMMKMIRKWVKEHKPNVVYIRSTTPTVAYKKTINIIKENGGKVVVEIPTFGGMERENSSRKLFYFAVNTMDRMFSSAYDNVDLYALIGNESTSYKGIKAINIENGIDLNLIHPKKCFQMHDNEIHLLAVAAITYWHGYDRLIKGLIDYEHASGNRKIFIHLCGNCSDDSLSMMKHEMAENNLSDRLITHGFVTGNALDDIYDECDIAVSSLGLHRAGKTIDTTLKVTEYTAKGIPFIYCAASKNINEHAEYCLRFPENEDNIDMKKIIKFFDGLNKETVSLEMRKFAEENLDWSIQLRKVIFAL